MLYPLLYQKPYLCAMACLQMVLFRRTGRLFDQEALGERFGAKVPEKLADIYGRPFGFMTAQNCDEGVSTTEIVPELNAFFRENGLSLEAEAHEGIGAFVRDLPEWLEGRLGAGDDVWIEYSLGKKGSDDVWIHDSLVETFDRTSGTVAILDPNPDERNRRSMPVSELADRISG